MNFLGDVVVSLLGSLGSLGVAFLIYKFTRRDEADRLEKPFAAERAAKLSDQARERRIAETADAPTILLELTRVVAGATIAQKPGSGSVDWESINAANQKITEHASRLNEARVTMTRKGTMFDDVQIILTACFEYVRITHDAVAERRLPIESWRTDHSGFGLRISNYCLAMRRRLINWEDTGEYKALVTPNAGGPSPGAPIYPSVGRS